MTKLNPSDKFIKYRCLACCQSTYSNSKGYAAVDLFCHHCGSQDLFNGEVVNIYEEQSVQDLKEDLEDLFKLPQFIKASHNKLYKAYTDVYSCWVGDDTQAENKCLRESLRALKQAIESLVLDNPYVDD